MHLPMGLVMTGLVLVGLSGCGSNPDSAVPPQGANAKSPLEYVNQSQLGKMLPSGARFQPDSAKDMGNGKFVFLDTTGKKYEVSVTSKDSGYEVGEPIPLAK